jgi:hypothetical protein
MSLYRKSLGFACWVLLVFITSPWWMLLLIGFFGDAGMVAGGAFWLSQGALMTFAFRCPACGRPAFRHEIFQSGWWTPWPCRICAGCGHDHQKT